ncbi:hypothetical protein BCR33DRAFT_711606 [Rhizoclosmatium globosum]|uniref:Uncharacterized protein n=1 Tax=Rhizoclosmatium globosum TaxID=329046 RepID=A0A1Y2D2D8_9FUNG|nr:hypothetical protein BCR33DRAFT_711606 [Rhizoclosmatium globosum]|eukprot:ORY53286.1 hypothetical protein BCR33DRAFT_711606 [Rhizoclosmatium globosum]
MQSMPPPQPPTPTPKDIAAVSRTSKTHPINVSWLFPHTVLAPSPDGPSPLTSHPDGITVAQRPPRSAWSPAVPIPNWPRSFLVWLHWRLSGRTHHQVTISILFNLYYEMQSHVFRHCFACLLTL